MDFTDTHANSLGWLLDSELGALDGVRCAVLVSVDGLIHSRTSSLTQDEGERHAAIASGLRASARAYSEAFAGGGVRQILLEFNEHMCLITSTGVNLLLLVQTTGPDVDIATITHQMGVLGGRVGDHLNVASRLAGGDEGAAG
ncbi:roadblock/LC7 domain-containing protein [Streptomyces sp. 5.8]|uniref:roadblock/LC7 domain-containing protein n=1 Tax=Streptomyces sp. 5.8 TaxID=3406571 RepID=UPI003BB5B037